MSWNYEMPTLSWCGAVLMNSYRKNICKTKVPSFLLRHIAAGVSLTLIGNVKQTCILHSQQVQLKLRTTFHTAMPSTKSSSSITKATVVDKIVGS